jgi:HSP20 family protein
MDELFDHFFGGSGNGQTPAPVFAPASLWEEEGRWCVEFDLPGVKQEDIDVTLEKNTLKLTAERHAPQEDRKFWHQERGYGRIERMITLPETVDPERIEAELKDGVLRLHLAKKPELQPKKIQVKTS